MDYIPPWTLGNATNPWLHIHFSSTDLTPGPSTRHSWGKKNPQIHGKLQIVTSPVEISHWHLLRVPSLFHGTGFPMESAGVAIKKSGCAREEQGQPKSICISPGSDRDSGGSCGFILNSHCYKTNASRAFPREKKKRRGGGVGRQKTGFLKNCIFFNSS